MIELVSFPYLNVIRTISGKASWSRTYDSFSQATIKISLCDDVCEYLGCWRGAIRFYDNKNGLVRVWGGVITEVSSSDTGVEVTASDYSVLVNRLSGTITGVFTPLQAWQKLASLIEKQFHITLDVTGNDSPYLLNFNNFSPQSVLEEISKVTDWTVVDETVFVGGQNRGKFNVDSFTKGYSTVCRATDIYTRITITNGTLSVTKVNSALEAELGFSIPKTIESTLATKTSLERYAETWLARAGTSLRLVANGTLDVCATNGVLDLIPGDIYSIRYRSFCDTGENTFRVARVTWDDTVQVEFDQIDENEDDSGAF